MSQSLSTPDMSDEEKTKALKVLENEEDYGGPVFEPRLYVQRYYYVMQQLAKFNVKHIVDFGSAECKISRFLVQIQTLENLSLVDLDGPLLRSNIHAIRPMAQDYLARRDLPLQVHMYQGSVTELDRNIVGCDAVSMVEIIEHLTDDVLEAAVLMVFSQLQPSIVVITTPNSDFNVLFPNFSGFRHWDHKFEWSQQQFREWCEDICRQYQYTVDIEGVGEPPPGSQHLGCCSQTAVFVRTEAPKRDNTNHVTDTYKLIAESVYPYKKHQQSDEEIILTEISYSLTQYLRTAESWPGFCPGCDDDIDKQLDLGFDETSKTMHSKTAFFSEEESENNSELRNNLESPENIASKVSWNQPFPKLGNQTECYRCENCDRARYQLQNNEILVPVTSFMNRILKTKLSPDQFVKFLQSHGYRLTSDNDFVIVHHDPWDTDGDKLDSAADDNDSAYETKCEEDLDVDYNSTEHDGTQTFDSESALQSETWD